MEDKLDKPFHDIVNAESITDLTVETADLISDKILSGEVIDGVPVIGLITKTYKVGKTVYDYFYMKKVMSFFFELKDYSIQERRDFTQRIQKSDGSNEKFGEAIMIIIDRLDSVGKAEIVGRLTSNLINKKISRQECLRLCRIVEKSFLEDIKALNRVDNKDIDFSDLDYSSLQSLDYHGLIWPKKLDHASWESIEDELKDREYVITSLGDKLIKFGMN